MGLLILHIIIIHVYLEWNWSGGNLLPFPQYKGIENRQLTKRLISNGRIIIINNIHTEQNSLLLEIVFSSTRQTILLSYRAL